MGYVKFSYDQLNRLCVDAFVKFGFSKSDAEIIKDVLLTSDLYGIESHGMQRMVRYHKGIEKVRSKLTLNRKLFSKHRYPLLSMATKLWVS